MAMKSSPHISSIEQYAINKVKEMRIAAGMSQADLAAHLNVSYGFIGQVENPKFRSKYNLTHLNELSKILKCSPREFIPAKAM